MTYRRYRTYREAREKRELSRSFSQRYQLLVDDFQVRGIDTKLEAEELIREYEASLAS